MYNLSDRSGHCRVRVKQRRYSESTCCLVVMITYKLNVIDSNIRNISIWPASLEVHLDTSACLLCLAINGIPARHDFFLDLLGFLKRPLWQICLRSCEQWGDQFFKFIKIGDKLSPEAKKQIKQLFMDVYLKFQTVAHFWILDRVRKYPSLLQIIEEFMIKLDITTLLHKVFQQKQVGENQNQLAVNFTVFFQKLFIYLFDHFFLIFIFMPSQLIANLS